MRTLKEGRSVETTDALQLRYSALTPHDRMLPPKEIAACIVVQEKGLRQRGTTPERQDISVLACFDALQGTGEITS
jgi:hypothetical protein